MGVTHIDIGARTATPSTKHLNSTGTAVNRAPTTFLDQIFDAHGGTGAWQAASAIHARVEAGGLLPATRMPGSRFKDYHLTIELDEQRATMDPFPEPGLKAIFDRGRVRIERTSGEVVARRDDPRAAFFGLSGVRRNVRCDALDAAYFVGYAMWNYLATPLLFTHPGVEVSDGGPWIDHGEQWRRLEVIFGGDLVTHSRAQTFYYDARGLLRRHDYVADIIGPHARVAHYCAEHAMFGGLVFPTRRRVLPMAIGNSPMHFPILISIDLHELRVEHR